MLSTLFGHIGYMPLFSCLLPLLWLGVIICLGLVVIQLNVSPITWLYKLKPPIIQQYKSYFPRLNHLKNRIPYLSKSKSRLIRYGLNCVLLSLVFQSNTAFSQTDTLTSSQKDSIAYYYLPFMISELQDYDLLKQKSALQDKQIKGLQAVSTNQKNLSVRQSIKIEAYANTQLKLQSDNTTLKNLLTATKKKAFWRNVENWVWRGGAIYLMGKIFKFY